MQSVACPTRATFGRANTRLPARIVRSPVSCRRVAVKAGEDSFDIEKIIKDLPVPVEYAYAGIAWSTILFTFNSPIGFLAKTLLLVHLLAAATSVARLGAIARPDQATGETEAGSALLRGLLIGPFNVGWFGVDRILNIKK